MDAPEPITYDEFLQLQEWARYMLRLRAHRLAHPEDEKAEFIAGMFMPWVREQPLWKRWLAQVGAVETVH